MYNNQVEQNIPNNTVVTPQSKKMPVWAIILIIVGGIILLGISIFIFVKLLGLGSNKYEGHWICNNSIELDISKNKFNMKYNDSNYAEADYFLVETTNENGYTKYLLRTTATKRIISGNEQTGDYITQFEISMEDGNPLAMAMMNTVSYSLYTCVKK